MLFRLSYGLVVVISQTPIKHTGRLVRFLPSQPSCPFMQMDNGEVTSTSKESKYSLRKIIGEHVVNIL